MKAWIFRGSGGPEGLDQVGLPQPMPRKGEILVRVAAAAPNPLDWKLPAGQCCSMTAGRLPRGVGCDYAAVLESVGEGTTHPKPGEAVVGRLDPLTSRQGAMAERVCARQALAVLKPRSLT
jgi:NADPH:quinone reductase-like Zn-dependent oxidoreductase